MLRGQTLRGQSAEDRFFAKVEEDGECWRWNACLHRTGYGRFGLPGNRTVFAHRWAYEFLRADIPPGLQLDHLCRNRACVNPWHLEPVTCAVNLARGHSPSANASRSGQCFRGHPKVRGKQCRVCNTAWAARKRAKAKAEAAA